MNIKLRLVTFEVSNNGIVVNLEHLPNVAFILVTFEVFNKGIVVKLEHS